MEAKLARIKDKVVVELLAVFIDLSLRSTRIDMIRMGTVTRHMHRLPFLLFHR